MKKALTALMAMAIVATACGNGSSPTPTPTRVLSSDEAYLLYMETVADNEMRTHNQILNSLLDAAEENSWAFCVWVSDLEDASEELMHALERAPRPQHPSLLKYHGYLLQAMVSQLTAVWYWNKGCATMDMDEINIAVAYQMEVFDLLGHASDALDEYEKSR